MKKNLIVSFLILFLLTGCSLNEIMDDLTNFNNLETIIAVLIAFGLVVSIVLKLLSRGNDNYDRSVQKDKNNNMDNFYVQQSVNNSNNNSFVNNSNNINNGFNTAPVTPNAGIDFEFYSDNNVNNNQLNNSSVTPINNVPSGNDNVVNTQLDNNSINAINSVPLVQNVDQVDNSVSSEVNNVPLVSNNVAFNDLANLENNNDNNQVEGPVINLNNQSVVVDKRGNE